MQKGLQAITTVVLHILITTVLHILLAPAEAAGWFDAMLDKHRQVMAEVAGCTDTGAIKESGITTEIAGRLLQTWAVWAGADW